MLEFRPTEVPSTRPRILLTHHWVEFSQRFPDGLDFVKGKKFSIEAQQQVSYPLSFTLKEGCYYDINFSNEDAGEKLYPDNTNNLYEVLIGLKEGNYYLIPYFPADYPVYRLDYPTMAPLVSDSERKHLGNIKPADSPADNPQLRFYFVYKLTPVILRVCVDEGVDYEKCTLELLINRCLMKQGTPPTSVTPKFIEYLDQIKTLTPGG
jgi:hypothetical protein